MYSKTVQKSEMSQEQEVLVELLSTSSRFSRAMSRLDGGERSMVSWRLLSNLRYHGPLRVTQLAELEKISQPAMTGIVNQLEKHGLVERKADETDKRAHLITLTQQGKDELADFRSRNAVQAAPAFAHLSDFDRAVLRRAFELLADISERLEYMKHTTENPQ